MKYNTTDTDGLLGVAFAALRYLEAREATEEAKDNRANTVYAAPPKHGSYDYNSWDYERSDVMAAHQKVLSAAARQSAAMRALKRAAKQLEDKP